MNAAFDIALFKGPVVVTALYFGLWYYLLQVVQRGTKYALKAEYEARGEVFDRYFGHHSSRLLHSDSCSLIRFDAACAATCGASKAGRLRRRPRLCSVPRLVGLCLAVLGRLPASPYCLGARRRSRGSRLRQ